MKPRVPITGCCKGLELLSPVVARSRTAITSLPPGVLLSTGSCEVSGCYHRIATSFVVVSPDPLPLFRTPSSMATSSLSGTFPLSGGLFLEAAALAPMIIVAVIVTLRGPRLLSPCTASPCAAITG